jgi:hypothetical protein
MMPKKVAVVFVHGILEAGIKYAERMRDGILARLPSELQTCVRFEQAFWAHRVRGRQQNYLKDARAVGHIEVNRLRHFLVEGLGDAAAYQKTRRRENSIYFEVQDEISATLRSFNAETYQNSPLIFIGHSLGCHIISSFAWDINKLKQRTEDDIKSEDEDIQERWRTLRNGTPFHRLDTFAGFVTLGSNMPLFTFTFGPDRVYPITSAPMSSMGDALEPAFPGCGLSPSVEKKARWLNFYSKRDILGFPLKCLNDTYSNTEILDDICVRSESLISRSLPYWSYFSAHRGYWTNPIVLDETASFIGGIIEAAQ